MRLMKKNIFNLLLFLVSTTSFASIVTEIFTIESNNIQSQRAKSQMMRLKLTDDLAYLSIINDRNYEECWAKFKNGRQIAYEISGSEMTIVSSNKKSVIYQLSINTDKIKFDNVNLRKEFKSFCIQ